MNFDDYQYHPRYTASEYHTLEAQERRRNRVKAAIILFGFGCLVALVAIVTN